MRRILAVLVVSAVLGVAGAHVAASGYAPHSAARPAGLSAPGHNRRLLAATVHLTADGVLVVWRGRGAAFGGARPATSTLARLRRRGANVPSVDQLFARHGRRAAYLLTVGAQPAADALIRSARRWRLHAADGQVGVVRVATAQPAVARRLRRLAPGLPVVSLRSVNRSQLGQRLIDGEPTPPPR